MNPGEVDSPQPEMSASPHAPRGGMFSRTLLASAGMAIQGLARFGYTLIIGRIAGAEALADASTVLSLAVWLSLVLPAPLGVAASRYLPVPEIAGAAVGQLNRWFFGSALTLTVISAPVTFWLVEDLATSLCAALLVFAYCAYVFTRGAMMGEDRILRATLADLVSSLTAITALVVVLVGGIHWAVLLPLALGYGVFAIASWPNTKPTPCAPAERSTILLFVRDSMLSGLATGGLLPMTMIFVRAYDSALQAGLFAAALSLATPASLVSQAVNQVLIPHFARLQGNPDQMRRSHRKFLAATVVLFSAVFGMLVAFANPILSVFYGSRFAEGAQPMQALLVVVFLISATCAPSAYLVAAGRQRAFALIWVAGFLVGAITMVWVSPSFGMWGALLGFAVGGGGGSLAVIVAGLTLPPRPQPLDSTRRAGSDS